MNHRELIASLSSEQRRALLKRSNGKSVLHLAVHWGVVGLLGWAIADEVDYWPVLMLFQGVCMVFLFTLIHETAHRTAFKSPWINRVVCTVCGFVTFLPVEWFRLFHFEHHRFTNIPGKDPELAIPKPRTLAQLLLAVSGLPTWWGLASTLYRNAFLLFEYPYAASADARKLRLEARLMLFGYLLLFVGSLIVGSTLLLYVWIFPLLAGQPFLRVYLMAEHINCDFGENMLTNTRTTKTNLIVRKLAWNMPYHVEHHCYPGVPYHNLPQLHELIKDHIVVLENGYGRFFRGVLRTVKS